jgi:hypothetical protein
VNLLRYRSTILHVLIFTALTSLTQVGGVIFILALLASRWLLPTTLQGWRHAAATTMIFIFFYQALSATVVPALAAVGGRIPLPCYPEAHRPFAAGSRWYCVLNRNYIDARFVTLMTELSQSVDRAYPGTITLYLDGNFPFVDGFPLLPPLSHNDGRKLDLAYYYASPGANYVPGSLRSPIGYWAFEQPGASEGSPCTGRSWLSLRWNLNFLQGLYPNRPLEPERTAAALRWLVDEGQKFGIERVFIEPYLATRLGVSSPVLGFQGCRAARHDDHIHIQIMPQR